MGSAGEVLFLFFFHFMGQQGSVSIFRPPFLTSFAGMVIAV